MMRRAASSGDEPKATRARKRRMMTALTMAKSAEERGPPWKTPSRTSISMCPEARERRKQIRMPPRIMARTLRSTGMSAVLPSTVIRRTSSSTRARLETDGKAWRTSKATSTSLASAAIAASMQWPIASAPPLMPTARLPPAEDLKTPIEAVLRIPLAMVTRISATPTGRTPMRGGGFGRATPRRRSH